MACGWMLSKENKRNRNQFLQNHMFNQRKSCVVSYEILSKILCLSTFSSLLLEIDQSFSKLSKLQVPTMHLLEWLHVLINLIWIQGEGRCQKRHLRHHIRKLHTVDRRNPAPVDMVNTSLFAGFQTCQVGAGFLPSYPPETSPKETELMLLKIQCFSKLMMMNGHGSLPSGLRLWCNHPYGLKTRECMVLMLMLRNHHK